MCHTNDHGVHARSRPVSLYSVLHLCCFNVHCDEVCKCSSCTLRKLLKLLGLRRDGLDELLKLCSPEGPRWVQLKGHSIVRRKLSQMSSVFAIPPWLT
eukprot:3938644-Amphidinium_carterae.1